MRWTRRRGASDIEDRRGFSARGLGLGAGGTIVVLLLSLVFGQDFFSLLGGGGGTQTQGGDVRVETTPAEDSLVQFVEFVVGDAQDVWGQLMGDGYRRARLVLFRDAVQSGCGNAQAAMGPFYCPADERVYVDLGFYDELRTRFGAPGDFAQAYVIAHEVGHHVQHLLGAHARAPRDNRGSVAIELQADCYAGIWAYTTAERGLLEPGDMEEGMQAAAAVGDDRLQRQQTGEVRPESFTHGSSADRVRWFRRGMERGDPQACNTFDGGR
jgi:predicted metalloprotease